MEGVKQQSRLNRRLLIFPAPFQGHLTPMIHLANLLYSKGFLISVIQTSYNALDSSLFPQFSFYTLDDGLQDMYSKTTTPDMSRVLSDMNMNCLEPFRDCLSQILSEAAVNNLEHISCMVVNPLWEFAGQVADSLKLPRLMLRTGSLSAYVVYSSLPSIKEKGYYTTEEGKLDEPLPDLPPFRVKDLPPPEDEALLAILVKEIKTSQGLLCNTFEELESTSIASARQILPIPLFPIGPLHKHSQISRGTIWTEDQTAIVWLYTQTPKSVLYVSFGSVAAMSKADFLEVAWGLANSRQPFLWVIRPGLIEGSEEADQLPEGYLAAVSGRGHIVKWAPQLEVLSHPAVGGFLTHCGWNSTLESISEGVPMLCLPLFADQAMNGRHVTENWKIGLPLEKGMKRKEIEKAIRKLMLQGEEMRSRITALEEKANLSLMEGGSSYKSLESLSTYLTSL